MALHRAPHANNAQITASPATSSTTNLLVYPCPTNPPTHFFIYSSIYMPTYPHTHPSTHPPIYSFIHPPIQPFVYLPIYPSLQRPAYPPSAIQSPTNPPTVHLPANEAVHPVRQQTLNDHLLVIFAFISLSSKHLVATTVHSFNMHKGCSISFIYSVMSTYCL